MSNFSLMKILLIYPYFLEARMHNPEDVRAVPIGLYYVAAVLKAKQYDVEILNWYNIHETPHKISEILTRKKPDVIGFSIFNANRWGGIEIARLAKKLNPRVKIVFGGIGATFLWEHLLTHFQEIDFVVIGEGEHTFLNLLTRLDSGQPEAIETINGIAYRTPGAARRTAKAETICQLDALPMPSEYFEFQHLALTRGCTAQCIFCGSPRFWGRKVRSHSADYFVQQIERLYQKGIRFFYFSDDTFTLHKKRVVEICQKIIAKKLDITWNAIARVDQVNEDILGWMRKAGCIQISYGVESGSAKIRNFLRKNISTADIRSAFGLTQKYGIMARAYIIYGCPQESWQTIQETIDLINEIKPLSIVCYILDIFPGTELYEDFKRRTGANDDIWLNRLEDITYFETDSNLTREMILAFGQKLRASFFENLPRYVEAIRLVDQDELYPLHSRFYARLAMTFDQGDYAKVDALRHPQGIAEKLYRQALAYYPNAEAYLGLGILNQKRGKHRKSIAILSQGLSHFPDDARLNICLSVGLMNLGDYQQALVRLLKLPHEKDALRFAARCYEALGDREKAKMYYAKSNQSARTASKLSQQFQTD
jgi:anaerobic magnesium-protoporphyrin IX monomethyl ester cyclase